MLPETPHTSLPPRACALAPLAAQRGHNGRRRHPPSRPAVRPRGHDEAASAWLKQRVATLHPRVHLGRVPCAHAGPGRVGRRASAQRTHRWWWQRRQRGVNQRQQCLQPSGGDARPSGLTLPPSSSRGAPPSPLHQHSELQPRLPTLGAPLSRSASEAAGSDGVASAASRAAPRLHETIYCSRTTRACYRRRSRRCACSPLPPRTTRRCHDSQVRHLWRPVVAPPLSMRLTHQERPSAAPRTAS